MRGWSHTAAFWRLFTLVQLVDTSGDERKRAEGQPAVVFCSEKLILASFYIRDIFGNNQQWILESSYTTKSVWLLRKPQRLWLVPGSSNKAPSDCHWQVLFLHLFCFFLFKLIQFCIELGTNSTQKFLEPTWEVSGNRLGDS